jgi:glycerate kinase
MIDAIADIKRLSGLTESEQMNEATVNSLDNAIAVFGNLRQQAKELETNQMGSTGGLGGMVVEELYSVMLFLDRIKRTA